MVITPSMLMILLTASVNGMPITDNTEPSSLANIMHHQHLLVPPRIDLINTYPPRFNRRLTLWKGSSDSSKPSNRLTWLGRLTWLPFRGPGKRSRESININRNQLLAQFPEPGKRNRADIYRYVVLKSADADVVDRITVSGRKTVEDEYKSSNQQRRFFKKLSSSNDKGFFVRQKRLIDCRSHPEICTPAGR